ncbi:MAG: CRISPR system precrRNA processing endoribonuclease RAMP protein Cas6 [Chloroflexota bacterium]
MLISAVIHLEALQDYTLDQFTGRGVHGLWFTRWRQVDATIAEALHADSQFSPFTLSPLMDLPRPRQGAVTLKAGHPAWVRVACLNSPLADSFKEKWLASLPIGSEIEIPQTRQEGEKTIPGLRWKVSGHSLDGQGHPLAAQTTYEELVQSHLIQPNPPRQWRLEFLTPTTFHGKTTHLPFPLPDSLVGSWLRRWQAFAPIALPEEEITTWARSNLAVSAYSLRTVPVREGERLRIGCVGNLTLRALDMPPYLRTVIDMLCHYALFAGSGSHTSQGMGQTRLASHR